MERRRPTLVRPPHNSFSVRIAFRSGVSLIVSLTVIVLAAAGCGSDENSAVDRVPGSTAATGPLVEETGSAPDDDPVLVRYAMSAGECPECGFDMTLNRDGTATLQSSLGDVDAKFDPTELTSLVAEFDRDDLVLGRDDCGRERDGNAPVLSLPGLELDLCDYEVDDQHPLLIQVESELQRLESLRDAAD